MACVALVGGGRIEWARWLLDRYMNDRIKLGLLYLVSFFPKISVISFLFDLHVVPMIKLREKARTGLKTKLIQV